MARARYQSADLSHLTGPVPRPYAGGSSWDRLTKQEVAWEPHYPHLEQMQSGQSPALGSKPSHEHLHAPMSFFTSSITGSRVAEFLRSTRTPATKLATAT